MTKRLLRTATAIAAPMILVGCAGAGLGGIGSGPSSVVAGQAQPISQTERQQGAKADPDIRAEFGGAYSGPQAQYAETVGRKIAVQSGLAATPGAFNVTLLDSSVNNAFAIPGGYIYITRQLMALANDEAEMAGVLGHEVGHVAARHSEQRQSAAQTSSVLGALGQLLVGAVAGNSQLGQLLQQGVGAVPQLLTLRFSRSEEYQADDLGVQYLAGAGYDPMAMSDMLASLAAQTSLESQTAGDARSVPEWASTHPDPAARVVRAANTARQVGAPPSGGVRNRDAFLAALDGVIYGDNPKQGVIEGQTFKHPDLRLAFSVPTGYAMQNGADAVSISGTNGQAQFSGGAYSGDLAAYIAKVLQGLSGSGASIPSGTVQRTTINGLPVSYETVRASSGNNQVDVTVLAYEFSKSTAYHFVMLTPAGQGLGGFQPMVQSLHRLSASEAAAIKPRRIDVMTVKSGDTPASLSARMAYTDNKLQRFLVLNGLGQNAVLRAGDKVKIVVQ